jgi:hypothetical protein
LPRRIVKCPPGFCYRYSHTLNHTNLHSNPSSHYAALYRTHALTGGHIIKLGPSNDDAARAALSAWPGGMQVGGGITLDNAREWLNAGASKVIVTSFLFPDAKFSEERLKGLAEMVGRERLVVDLSCRRRERGWVVAMNGWKTLTDTLVTKGELGGRGVQAGWSGSGGRWDAVGLGEAVRCGLRTTGYTQASGAGTGVSAGAGARSTTARMSNSAGFPTLATVNAARHGSHTLHMHEGVLMSHAHT